MSHLRISLKDITWLRLDKSYKKERENGRITRLLIFHALSPLCNGEKKSLLIYVPSVCLTCLGALRPWRAFIPYMPWPTTALSVITSYIFFLVSNGKYIHFQHIFLTSLSLFRLQVSAIHKANRILLISLQILIKSFASNIIIGIMCRIPGTWLDSSTVNFTEEFFQHRKEKKSCPWLLNNRESDCWTVLPLYIISPYNL